MDTTVQMRPAISGRIDRLPLSREIWGIMVLAGVAWLVESYDVGVTGIDTLPLLHGCRGGQHAMAAPGGLRSSTNKPT